MSCLPIEQYQGFTFGIVAAIDSIMIKNSKQNWNIGQTVNVGFLKGFLVVAIHDVKDGMPDIYTLTRNGKTYEFIPHNGLNEVTPDKRAG